MKRNKIVMSLDASKSRDTHMFGLKGQVTQLMFLAYCMLPTLEVVNAVGHLGGLYLYIQNT